jgi:ABC-type uncharacterized transport system permease subunit
VVEWDRELESEEGRKVYASLIRAGFFVLGTLACVVCLIFAFSSLSMGIPFVEILGLFIGSSVGSTDSVLRSLARTTPLLISTLGLLVAFKSGVWNIGGEGQIVLGAVVATGICLFLPVHPLIAVSLSLLASFVVGGAYAALAGFLKARWGVNEVVVTMMQNFVALALLQYLIDGPWNWGVGLYPRTALIPEGTRLPFIAPSLSSMFLVALALAYLTHVLMNRTVPGYEMRAMGDNRDAAFTHGVDVGGLTVLSMLVSGGICGLAGSGIVLGYFFRAQAGISGNYGFYAIASALIAGNRAALAPLSSLLIALVYEGTLGLTVLGIPHRLCEAIVGIVFIVVLLPEGLGWLREGR